MRLQLGRPARADRPAAEFGLRRSQLAAAPAARPIVQQGRPAAAPVAAKPAAQPAQAPAAARALVYPSTPAGDPCAARSVERAAASGRGAYLAPPARLDVGREP